MPICAVRSACAGSRMLRPAPMLNCNDFFRLNNSAAQNDSSLNELPTVNTHITVCICTYKRPRFLRRLLDELRIQDTEDQFSYSIVVADNDHLESAKPVVLEFLKGSSIPIKYCVEPRQNIALARNRAIENASGEYVVFIDDDEFPIRTWLLTL